MWPVALNGPISHEVRAARRTAVICAALESDDISADLMPKRLTATTTVATTRPTAVAVTSKRMLHGSTRLGARLPRPLRHHRYPVNELAEAADNRQLSGVVARYSASTCSCATNSATSRRPVRGQTPLPGHHRTRRESFIGLATKMPFSIWGAVSSDPRLVAAIGDATPSTPTSSRLAPALPAEHQQNVPE